MQELKKDLIKPQYKYGVILMTKYYIAVTYDVCEHNNLYEDMNGMRMKDEKAQGN